MKKILLHTLTTLCLTATALFTTSCQTEAIEMPDNEEKMVHFATEVTKDAATKSTTITSNNDLADIGVFCSHTDIDKWNASTHLTQKMQNIKLVNRNNATEGATPAWNYANPSDATYWNGGLGERFSFFAYSPYAASSNGLSNITNNKPGYPVIRYNEPTDITQRPDFMVAIPRIDIHPISSVSFKMEHALTALSFSANIRPDVIDKVQIKSITLNNVQTGGSVKLNADNNNNIVWDVDYTTASQKNTTITDGNILDNSITLTTTHQSITKVNRALFVIPQKLNPLQDHPTLSKMTLSVIFVSNGIECSPISFDLSALPDWVAGKAVDYQITFIPADKKIDINLTVTEWGVENIPTIVEGTYLNISRTSQSDLTLKTAYRIFYGTDYIGAVTVSSSNSNMTVVQNASNKYIDITGLVPGTYKVYIKAGRLTRELTMTFI